MFDYMIAWPWCACEDPAGLAKRLKFYDSGNGFNDASQRSSQSPVNDPGMGRKGKEKGGIKVTEEGAITKYRDLKGYTGLPL